ncbi:peptidyl-prolyl cis-trans isomerase [Vibrio azureus]|uniref:Peptidyl-prolyl cis-trans isomerase n=1 Tax=Vibrio azureus NBRC 104587 TaxID=1219077 RepID=U3AMA7_9VIBR|nr:peptidylprolyl isomerase [Vibrio azureus]AUI86789.1 peptidyl-prolyl cis-trans isomerase [Vibrio azureus]GAD74437.1 peptidyl-prolyl cis-trans isomerase A [Vibrio azureus NBRC 104587]
MLKKILLSLTLFSASVFAGPNVLFETSEGDFTVELNQEKAPVTVENFLKYVKDGSYKGTIFHRIIPDFMAQGGGFNQDMQKVDTFAPIKNEANNGLKNDMATIAMARTNDPNSATRQFFINYVNNDYLNANARSAGYAVFGKVVSGFPVVQKMATIPTKSVGRLSDVPTKPIIIKNVTLLK